MENTIRPFFSNGILFIAVGIFMLISNFSGSIDGLGSRSIGGIIGSSIDIVIPLVMFFLAFQFISKRIDFSYSQIVLIGIIKKQKLVRIIINDIISWKYNSVSDEFEIKYTDNEIIKISAKNESAMKNEIFEHLSRFMKSL
jgi:hypothetical protein